MCYVFIRCNVIEPFVLVSVVWPLLQQLLQLMFNGDAVLTSSFPTAAARKMQILIYGVPSSQCDAADYRSEAPTMQAERLRYRLESVGIDLRFAGARGLPAAPAGA